MCVVSSVQLLLLGSILNFYKMFNFVLCASLFTVRSLQKTLTWVHYAEDWIVQCFTSTPTQYRLYGRRYLQVKRPNQQYQSTEGDATTDKANNENN